MWPVRACIVWPLCLTSAQVAPYTSTTLTSFQFLEHINFFHAPTTSNIMFPWPATFFKALSYAWSLKGTSSKSSSLIVLVNLSSHPLIFLRRTDYDLQLCNDLCFNVSCSYHTSDPSSVMFTPVTHCLTLCLAHSMQSVSPCLIMRDQCKSWKRLQEQHLAFLCQG